MEKLEPTPPPFPHKCRLCVCMKPAFGRKMGPNEGKHIPARSSGLSGPRKVDAKALGSALKAGDTASALALMDAAGLSVDADVLFWDYVSDPTAGLPAATSLHYASHCDVLSSVQWLLDLGADPGLRDALGRLPIDVAISDTVRSELNRGAQAFAARQRLLQANEPKPDRAPVGKAAPPGTESSESIPSCETKDDTNEGNRVPPQAGVSTKAAELLKEVERVKQEAASDRVARTRAHEANMAALQTLEVWL